MHRLKYSRLRLTKVERGGFFALVVGFAILLILELQPSNRDKGFIDLDSKEIQLWLKAYDSIVTMSLRQKQRVFRFNPNFITPSKADRLGLTASEFKRFQAFRLQGKWINSVQEFQEVTGVSQSWLNQYSSLFKFPDFINRQKTRSSKTREKIPFLRASAQALKKIHGIGPVIAKRIIQARDQWGGISSVEELELIYGMTARLKEAILQSFSFDEKTVVTRNVNELFPSDLSEIPGIDFSLAKKIWEFVRLRQGLANIDELLLIEEIQPRLFAVIQLYLYAMKNES